MGRHHSAASAGLWGRDSNQNLRSHGADNSATAEKHNFVRVDSRQLEAPPLASGRAPSARHCKSHLLRVFFFCGYLMSLTSSLRLRAIFARGISGRTVATSAPARNRSPFSTMADLTVPLTAPNGKTWSQPTGLFINNEFVKSSSGSTITSIDPAYVSNSR